ncbi:MAG: CHAP domain-containing protein [Aeromicrobium erythreum]
MSRISAWLGVLIFAACLVPLSAAQSASSLLCTSYSSCSRAGYSHYGYESKQRTSYWRMYSGTNCTNYVAYRLITTNGMSTTRPRSGVGNARDWGPTMKDVTDKTPTAGSVAWWGRPSGGNHVAYVERVISSTEILVSESNYGRAFDWRRISKGSGWPDGFIHFADVTLSNTAKPTVGGTVKVGVAATATPGSWTMTPSLSYQWLLDGKAVSKATGRTFTPPGTAWGRKLSVKVTAKKSGYPTKTATSAARTISPGKLDKVATPKVTGDPAVGRTLGVDTDGAWSPTPETFKYQWSADGEPVEGATEPTFTPDVDQLGDRISVALSVSKPGHGYSSATTAATPAVVPGTLTASSEPSVTRSPVVDRAIEALPGRWSQADVTVTRRWTRDGTTIPGATGATYTPTPAEVGSTIAVVQTISRPGYTTVTRTLTAGKVGLAAFSAAPQPTVSGRPTVGEALKATPGTWAPTATLTYRWSADGRAIEGATGPTFVAGAAQQGKVLTVSVTGQRPGYTSRTVTSARTAAVAAGRIAFRADPRITGSARPGSRLTAEPEVTVPSGGRVTYRWYRGTKPLSATGRTYTPVSGDLGHRLSVEVTASAPGYVSAKRRTAETAVVKSPARLTVKGTGERKAATFRFTVTAAGTTPTGTVSVTLGSKQVRAKLVDGRATLRLTKIYSGKNRSFRVAYSGNSKVDRTSHTVKVTVR